MGAGNTNDAAPTGGTLAGRDLRAGPDAEFGEATNDEVVVWRAHNVGDDGASAGLEFTKFSALT